MKYSIIKNGYVSFIPVINFYDIRSERENICDY